jgi:putative phosphoserine phosphatase/1-acylglycerol-3-phosphate O-acyltransferase
VVDLALKQHLQTISDVNSKKKTIVFFDLDRTLISGYSIIAIAWERIQQGISRGEFRQSLKILKEIIQQKRNDSEDSYQHLVGQLSKHFAGIPEQTMADLGEKAYHRTLARSLYRESITLVEAHRAAGHHLVILSAASQYQIAPIARVLGIDEVCCTRMEVVDGCFTGKTISPVCYGDGKTLAARRVAKRLKTTLAHCWFYSDSSHDLPMLEAVGHPVATNASEKLAVHARARHWPQLNFDSRGLPSSESILRTMLTIQTLLATSIFCALSKPFDINKVTNANRVTQIIGDVGTAFAGIKLNVQGKEHLTSYRPAIFVFNHQSLLDSMILSHMLRYDCVGLCKKEVEGNILMGPLLRQIDTIFASLEEEDQEQDIKRALEILESGRSIVMAPEGTRSTLGDIQPFKHGAFKLAKLANVPVVPVVLHNVKDALPKGSFIIRPATIQVTVLPPMLPKDMGTVHDAAKHLEDQYADVLDHSEAASMPYKPPKRKPTTKKKPVAIVAGK